jgi:ubiquinone/menaquinone biosynthesis C-methylase UbiE
MATYAEKDFDSNNYVDKRPGYPDSLFDALFTYHQGATHFAVDVGSGPGTASFSLLEKFETVLATDPSDVMIKPGIEAITPDLRDRISFKVSPAEDLSSVVTENGSVDLIICAEALHWINHGKFFREAHRVLRSGGTLAYWGYVEPRFIDFPKANEIYEKYVFEDPRYLGPFWKPGKEYLRYFFDDVQIPTEMFSHIEKHDYYPGVTEKKTAYYLGDGSYTLSKFSQYLSSWSAVHSWTKEHPGEDIISLFINELKDSLGWDSETELRVEWGTTYTFSRKI